NSCAARKTERDPRRFQVGTSVDPIRAPPEARRREVGARREVRTVGGAAPDSVSWTAERDLRSVGRDGETEELASAGEDLLEGPRAVGARQDLRARRILD